MRRLAWRNPDPDKITVAMTPSGWWETSCAPCVRKNQSVNWWHGVFGTSVEAFAWTRGHLSWHREQVDA